MAEFYARSASHVDLLGDRAAGWRPPQIGALGATMAHWSVSPREPIVVSIPTGSGKTAIGLAAPFLMPRTPRRVLVLAPGRHLRRQLADHFASYAQLKRLGVLANDVGAPSVIEMTGRSKDWAQFESADVVVALPNSISPLHYELAAGPPVDLFQLIIVDEAHHAPADTWRAILEHFGDAHSLLLTRSYP